VTSTSSYREIASKNEEKELYITETDLSMLAGVGGSLSDIFLTSSAIFRR
jgi:hypothetical protein